MNILNKFTFIIIIATNIALKPVIAAGQADTVQVHEQYSNLISKCSNLGPLNLRHKPSFLGTLAGKGREETIEKARERAAEMNGDSLVLINMQEESLGAIWRLQSVVLSCFNDGTGKYNIITPDNKLYESMECQTDSQCGIGMSCRSKKGGGTECGEIK